MSSYTSLSTKEPTSVHEEVEDGEAGEIEPKALLSVPQLVLRRGLAVLAVVLLLALSVTVHLTCPPPQHFKSNLTTHWGNHTTPPALPDTTTATYLTTRPI